MHRFSDGPTVSFLLGNHRFLSVFIMLIIVGGFIDDTQVLFEANNNVLQGLVDILGKGIPRLFNKPTVIPFIIRIPLVAQ